MKNLYSLLTLLFINCSLFVGVASAQNWTQLGSDIDGEVSGTWSGYSVRSSSDGTRVAIGGPGNDDNGTDAGHVRIYDWNGTSWIQLGADIDGEAVQDFSGLAVSLSGNGLRVSVGAYLNDGNGANAGHVRVYEWNGSAWTQLGSDIDGEAAGDESGYSVSLNSDGSRVAIGAPQNDDNGTAAGHVRVYNWNGTSWTQMGSDIDGESAGSLSGYSLSLSSNGTRVAIGGHNNDDNGTDAGHVRIYDWNGSIWTQLGSDIDGEAAWDESGKSVSLSGDGTKVAIGARDNDGNGANAGHARIYEWNGGNWLQLGSDIDGEAAGDLSGTVSLSNDGTRIAVGAYWNAGNGASAGHVRIYDWNGTAWAQVGNDIDGEASGDRSGSAVSLSGTGLRVAIGAYVNDGNGTSSGHVRVYEACSIPAQPGAISGNNPVCPGSSQTYNVTAVAGATSYTWTLPGSWTGTSTTNSITVTVGPEGSSGTVQVTADNACGSSAPQTLSITVPVLDDGISCTEDVCSNGVVSNNPNDNLCDDNDPGTVNTCDPNADCQTTFVPFGTPCDDGNACTESDQWDGAGTCSGTPLNCDDGDPNTVDSCDPGSGCVHTPVNPPAGSLHFDGVDRVQMPTPIIPTSGSWTISAWARSNPGSYGQRSPIISQSGPLGQTRNLILGAFQNQWIFEYVGSTVTTRNMGTISPGTWVNLTVTWDGSIIRCFTNGLPGQSSPLAGFAGFSGVPTEIGRDISGGFGGFNGNIDEVRIWNRALCETEVQHYMSCELTGAETGLIHYYDFNQGFVGANNSGETTLTDNVGSSDGALIGFALNGTTSNWSDQATTVTGTCGAFGSGPEINVTGLSQTIVDGDATPTTSDGTDFGSMVENGAPVAHTFIIENTGTANLTISSITITGTNASEFSITQSDPTGVYGPGQTLTFEVTYDGSPAGTHNATIEIANSDCDESTYNFAITGVTTSPPAGSLHFDGTDDNVEIPASTSLNIGTNAVTVEAWIKPAFAPANIAGSFSGIFDSPSDAYVLYMDKANNELRFKITDSDNTAERPGIPTASIIPDTWMHVAGVYDGSSGSAKVYLNGAEVDEHINAALVDNVLSGQTAFIGASSAAGGSAFDGEIDEVRIWNRALCAAEINHYMNCEPTGSETGLVAYYDFNQGFVGANNSGETTLTDNAGSNDGALNNFALNGTPSNWSDQATTVTGTCGAYSGLQPEINVTGLGQNIVDGDATPTTTDDTDFGSMVVNGTPVVHTFTIENTGTADLTISGVTITGTNAAEFSVTASPSSPVSAGGSTTFQVTYDGSAVGTHNATIEIANSDCDEATYNFAITGETTPQPAGGLRFDGTNDRVDIAARIPTANDSTWSFSVWVMPDIGSSDGNNHGIIAQYQTGGANGRLHLYEDGGSYILFYGHSGGNNGGNLGSAPENVWTHLAVTYDGTNLKGYKNGVLSFTGGALAGGVLNTTTRLGRSGNASWFFDGRMDEVRFWDYALCEDEILASKDCELTGTEPGLISYYKFNQGYLAANNAGETSLIDAVATGVNGSLNNFALTGGGSNWQIQCPDVSGNCANPLAIPEINVTGNSVTIVDGSLGPNAGDDTDFGTTGTGTPVVHTFTIENTGTSDLTISGVSVTPSTHFTITANPSSPVSASGSTTFQVTYNPNAVGTHTATVEITSDDCDEDDYTFLIQGQAVPAPDYTITTTGNQIVITDIAGNGEGLAISDDATNVTFNVSGRYYSLDGGSATLFPVDIPISGVTSVTVNTEEGNDIIGITALQAFPSLTINGGVGNDEVHVSQNNLFASNANVDFDLQNDDPSPGIDHILINIGASLTLSGTGSIDMKTSQNILCVGSNDLITENGNITIEANQQATPTSGNFQGIDIESGSIIEATGTGIVSIKGKGGTGTQNSGIRCDNDITSSSGNIYIHGTSRNATSRGVHFDSAANIESTTGDISITATNTSGGLAYFQNRTEVECISQGSIEIVTDHASIGTYFLRTADASGSVTFKPESNGIAINLGGNDVANSVLGLTDYEIDKFITPTPTINIGDANSGDLTISAAITRSYATDINLSSGTGVYPNYAGVDIYTGGGTLKLANAGILVIDIDGTTVNTQYQQLAVNGLVDLNLAQLLFTGSSHTPTAGEQFIIVNNDGADAITSFFSTLPEGATISNFLGSGLDATISYVGGDGNDAVITVVANQDPVAALAANPNPASCGQNISFDGSSSYHPSPGRTIVLYEWDWDNDGTYDDTGVNASHSYSSAGSQTVVLRVTDDIGATDTETISITINNVNCGNNWTGNTDTDWNDPTNWSSGTVPTSSTDAVIPTTPAGGVFPIMDVNSAAVRDLEIQNGATVTVPTGMALTVSGVLTNNGTVYVNDSGSLVQSTGSTLAGNGTYQVVRQGATGQRFNFWSSPITSQSGVPGTSYSYNSNAGTQDDTDDQPSDPGWGAYNGAMVPGVGYAGNGGGLATFTGTVNNGNVDRTLVYYPFDNTYTQTTPGTPFNLVGNPYPSAISASNLISDNPDIDGTIFFWDDDLSAGTDYHRTDFAYWNGTGGLGTGAGSVGAPNGFISTAQGFYVRALNGSAVLNFNNAQRVVGPNTQFFRVNGEDNKLWLSIETDSLFNQVLIGAMVDATEDEDRLYDAVKMRGPNGISLSAMANDIEHAIMAIPPPAVNRTIPLRVATEESGTHVFKVQTIENFEEFAIYLDDIQSGISTELEEGIGIPVTLDAGEYTDRFYLNLVRTSFTGIDNTEEGTLTVYAANGFLHVGCSGCTPDATIELLDMSGRVVLSDVNPYFSGGVASMDISGISKGIYVVRVTTENQVLSTKILKD